MLNYIHSIPTKVYFGKGQISHLDESLRQFGMNVLLTYGGGSIRRIGLYDEVIRILSEGGFHVTELPGIDPNPRIESVREGVRLCKENHIDVILAVGGGSTIDCSKAIAAGVFYEGEDLWDMMYTRPGPRKALPVVDILTISATGSDFNLNGVITNPETKEKMGSSFTFPSVSILDPTYTFSVSRYQTAAGGIDIMSHAMERYFSETADSDLAEGAAETIIRSVIKNLPIALKEPDNYTARANLMAAQSVSCTGIPSYGKKGTGSPCHAMEHELSAYYDVTHGVGLAILTPRWMRYILEKDPSCAWRFAGFARNVWDEEDEDEVRLALTGIERLERFFTECGVPMTFTELGIGPEHFEAMAAHCDKVRRLDLGLVPLTAADVVEIYKACL